MSPQLQIDMEAAKATLKPTTGQKLQLAFCRNIWLLADQALVSGLNFATSALLARTLGIHNYGLFSIFYIVLQYAASIQNATLLSPMLSLAPQMLEEDHRQHFLRGSAGLQIFFSVTCAVIFCLVGLLARIPALHISIEPGMVVPFMLTILFVQLQEWLRRRFYVVSQGKNVFWNDLISYGGQIIILAILWKIGLLTVSSAYFAIAVTSLVAFFLGWLLIRVCPTLAEIRAAALPTWRLGKNLLMVIQFQWLGTQGILLIVAAMIDINSASGMRAVITLLGPVTIFYQLLDNIIPVRVARIYAMAGRDGLIRYMYRILIALVIVLGVPLLVIAVFSHSIMVLAFGKPFGVFAPLVVWQCLYAGLALVNRGLQYYHRTVGTAAILAKSALFVAPISVAACFILIHTYGAVGAMVALVVGQAFNILIPLRYARYAVVKGSK